LILSLKGFTQLVQDAVAAVQAAAPQLVDLTVGSALRAVLEASASTGLWMQWLILQVLRTTRLATSSGVDVDSWLADFTLARLPATAAAGGVTFSRFSFTLAALVPLGANVKTSDGLRTYTVVTDTTNPAWNGSTGYTLGAGVPSVTCAVQDVTTDASGNPSVGSAGNVVANTITLLASAIPGVDTVANAAGFISGVDAESDAAGRARFANFIQTRSRATPAAVSAAIAGVQQGLNWTIQENVAPNGAVWMGNFVVTVDDGSGAPPSSLLTSISLAIAAVRPIGSTWSVQGPVDTLATISLSITTFPAGNKPALLGTVENALLAFINSMPVGMELDYSRVSYVAFAADPSITDVHNVIVNGATADLVPGVGGAIKATAASITIN
jgi:hypothetical protein